MFDYQTEPQLIPKLSLQVSVTELHNSGVSGPNYGVIKDAKYEDDNIIISDSTFRSLLPPKLKRVAVKIGTGGDTPHMLVRVGNHGRGTTKYTGNK